MTLPTGRHRCAVCGIASELDPRGICWRCAPSIGECARCGVLVELIDEDPESPYWSHLDIPTGPEHAATVGRVAS